MSDKVKRLTVVGSDWTPPDAGIDEARQRKQDEEMSTPTRDEFLARIEAIEAKMDGRVASIEHQINGFLGTLSAHNEIAGQRDRTVEAQISAFDSKVAAIGTRFSGMEDKFATIESKFTTIESSLGEIRSDSKALKFWLIGTGLAVVLGVAAFNATVLSNMVASFESGKNTSAAQAQVMQQVKDTQALLDEVKRSTAAQPAVSPQK